VLRGAANQFKRNQWVTEAYRSFHATRPQHSGSFSVHGSRKEKSAGVDRRRHEKSRPGVTPSGFLCVSRLWPVLKLPG
jgi:hypothetical protein